MDDQHVGRSIRAVRIRKGWRQKDLAVEAKVSQDAVSRLERGLLGGMTVESIRAIGQALNVLIDVTARWQGGELDRLLGWRHSALHECRRAALRGAPGLGDRSRGHVLDLRGARSDRHPRLARAHAHAARHRAQDGDRGHPGAAGRA